MSRRALLGLSAALGYTALVAPLPARAATAVPYPVGTAFPLGWYAITPEFLAAERANGSTLAHIYGPVDTPTAITYLDQVAGADLTALCRLPLATTTEPRVMPPTATAVQAITDRVGKPVAWWDIPEEMRYWYADELNVVTSYAALTRQHDPQQRPNYMYTPNHYLADDLAHYVPHLDIVPVSAYRSFWEMPPAWTRWRLQQMHEAVAQAGAVLGRNYLAGQKTITASLELFTTAGTPIMTAADARHDFWTALAGGAKGIMIYSWAHRVDDPALVPVLASYHSCIDTLLGTTGLAAALLFGSVATGITATVTAGPTTAAPFQPYGVSAPLTLPSFAVRVVTHLGHQYVVAVNSADQPITLRVSGLAPFGGDSGTVTPAIDPLDVVILTR